MIHLLVAVRRAKQVSIAEIVLTGLCGDRLNWKGLGPRLKNRTQPNAHLIQIHERIEKVADFVQKINVAGRFREQLLIPIERLIAIFQLLIAVVGREEGKEKI